MKSFQVHVEINYCKYYLAKGVSFTVNKEAAELFITYEEAKHFCDNFGSLPCAITTVWSEAK